MIPEARWLDRKFTFDLPIGSFPQLLERLRGTPVRAKELVTGQPEQMLATRVEQRWSVKEHLGHLADLKSLDDRRLNEFLNHAEVLSPADIENRATELADHASAPIAEIIRRLTVGRDALVRRLEVLTEEEVEIIAVHPRLQKPMRLLDWVYFVAEHDDHHLAQARRVLRTLRLQH
jgi:uncharacterized damage-inducible protein DinB